ncbi:MULTISPECIES: Lsr2 family protein [Arthrobacter]|nr:MULTISPECIES: Lsr2 family protein [Arthrobacter]MBT8162915.1 Lsr2 family protein [Arthrobacter sp. GN70]
MAKRSIIESDISGKSDAGTVTFGLGDTWYEIDLTADERQELEASLQRYLKAGRKHVPEEPEKKPVVPATSVEERLKIREWGKANGEDVPEFGRLPKALMAAYDKAHNIKRDK